MCPRGISSIKEMPLGNIDSHDSAVTQLESDSIKSQLEKQFSLLDYQCDDKAAGPSRYLKIAGTATKVGFISPMSHNFCHSCNRVRLTTEGRLLVCLGNEHSLDLRKIVRNRPDDLDYLKQRIIKAMSRKPERHFFDPNDITIMRHMNATGG